MKFSGNTANITHLTGALLRVSVSKAELLVSIIHPYVDEQQRGFRRDRDSRLYIWNHRFEKRHAAPAGIGLQSFVQQVSGARKLGVARIETFATGEAHDRRYNGYYVWALFGYDAPLTLAEQRLLLPPLRGAKTLNELFELGGESWWQEHGTARRMVFELAAESTMMKRLRAYLRKKGLLERYELELK